MRNRILFGLAMVAALAFAGGSAEAKITKFWSAELNRYMIFDSDNPHPGGGGRDYSPVPRQDISYTGPYGPKTIIINTTERRLYYVTAKGQAIKYGIGVGRDGFTWSGSDRISRKAEWPGWTPPPVMVEREKAKGRILPAYMKGGPGNPLGARALYIGARIYRIHGTSEPWTIGQAVSSGCIRLINDDIIDLYNRVDVGTRVVVLN